MTALYRFDALVVAHDEPIVPDGGLLERDGRIIAAGPFDEVALLAPDVQPETIHGVAIPGLIDAHSHLRGMPLELHDIAPAPLEPWICSLAAMTALDPEEEAFVAAADLLGTGVTAVQGIAHTFDRADRMVETVDRIRTGLQSAGIRALLVVGFTDRAERAPLPQPASLAHVPYVEHGTTADEWADIVRRIRESEVDGPDGSVEIADGSVEIAVGPVAAQWCSDPALEQIALLRDGMRVHVHLNESAPQRTWVQDEAAPVARLERHGLLGDFVSAAHGVHLSAAELGVLSDGGVTLVHCPSSNERLSVGTADVSGWRAAGIPVALGLDSQSDGLPDMFAEMRAAQQTASRLGTRLTARDVFGMATEGGARALGIAAGRLVPGAFADFAVLDLPLDIDIDFDARRDTDSDTGTDTDTDTIERIVARGSRERITEVVVGGHRVVRHGIGRDRAAVEAQRASLAAELLADRGPRMKRLRDLAPAIAELTEFEKAFA